jgi:hypothetical protein
MRLVASVLVIALAGCQTENYGLYAQSMARIAEANASVAREQAAAMERLAQFSGASDTVRTVAVIMLAMGAQNAKTQVNVVPPQNEALQWAQVLLPSISTLALGYWGYHLGKTQSNNAADVSIAGYNAMNGIANSGFNAVGAFKPVPIDWTNFPVTNHIEIGNRDGQVVIGGDGAQDNSTRPVVIVPPVFAPVPVVPVP